MKANIQIITLIFLLTTSCATYSGSALDQQSNVSFQVFYDNLDPYGRWVDYDNYGYVWIPYTRGNFAPYSTNGYWINTTYGWAWMSSYNWGWAPFHYGRWGFNDALGWFWVPGYEWGPAWVNWLQADGYYGWSPIAPGMSINFYFDGRYDRYHDHWCFVRDRDFGRRDIHRYYINRSDHEQIYRNSRVIDRTYVDNKRHSTYVYGPERKSVQRASGSKIDQYNIRESSRPGQEIQNRELRIYRPQIDRNSTPRQSTPQRVIRKDDLIRTPGRDVPNRDQNVTPTERPTTQPEKRDVPRDINVPPVRQQDVNQPVRIPRTATPDRSIPERKTDVTTPQRQNVQPDQPVQRRDITQPERTQPVQRKDVTQPERTQPVQRKDVTQPESTKPTERTIPPVNRENRTQPQRNKDVSPRQDTKPVRESRTTDRPEKKDKEKSPNSEQEKN